MALVREEVKAAHRSSNIKESEWGMLCKDALDRCINDETFINNHTWHNRQDSKASCLWLSPSGVSVRSIGTASLFPIPANLKTAQLVHHSREAPRRRPRPKASADFWDQTIKTLERNKAETEANTKLLRSAKSQPDFFSPGGFPPPPGVSWPSASPSLLLRRQRARMVGGAVGGKRASRERAASHGRSTVGAPKSTPRRPQGAVGKWNVSPTKISSVSRFRSRMEELLNSPSSSSCGISKLRTLACPASDASSSPLAPHSQQRYIRDPQVLVNVSPVPPLQQRTGSHRLDYTSHATRARSTAVQSPTRPTPGIELQPPNLSFPVRGSSLAALKRKTRAFDFDFGDGPSLEIYSPGQENFSTPFPLQDTNSANDQPIISMPQLSDPFYDASHGMKHVPAETTRPRNEIVHKQPRLSYTVPSHDDPVVSLSSRRLSTPKRMLYDSPVLTATGSRSRRAGRSKLRSRTPSRRRRAKSSHATPRKGLRSAEKSGIGVAQ